MEERSDVTPLCPHCGARVDKISYRRLRGLIGKRFVYFCPHCHKVLGVSHRKGLILG